MTLAEKAQALRDEMYKQQIDHRVWGKWFVTEQLERRSNGQAMAYEWVVSALDKLLRDSHSPKAIKRELAKLVERFEDDRKHCKVMAITFNRWRLSQLAGWQNEGHAIAYRSIVPKLARLAGVELP